MTDKKIPFYEWSKEHTKQVRISLEANQLLDRVMALHKAKGNNISKLQLISTAIQKQYGDEHNR